MAAELKLFIDYGGVDGTPAASHDTSADTPNIRFKVADNDDIDTNNQIPIPPTGVRRSYWKNCYIKRVDVAPSTVVNNLKIYYNGDPLPTGVTLKIGTAFPVKNHAANTGYKVATGLANVDGDVAAGTMVDITTYTSGVPLSLTISEASSQLDAENETSNYFVLQLEITPTAAAGTLDTLPIDIDYSEA